MPAKNWISWNLAYIKTHNSCDNVALQIFYDDILEHVPNGFTRRRYIWNILRGKSFYINAARYVISNLQETRKTDCVDPKMYYSKAARMLRSVLVSTKSEKIRKSFVRNIVKTIPLLTVETIQYLDTDRITMILNSGDGVFSDEHLDPFIQKISDQMVEIENLKQLAVDLGGM